MNRKTSSRRRLAGTDEWDLQWQRHWSKVGLPGYELLVGGPGGYERGFLAHARAPAKERRRLKRINEEFACAFKVLFGLVIVLTFAVSLHIAECPPRAMGIPMVVLGAGDAGTTLAPGE